MRLYELVDAYKASHYFSELAPSSQVSYQQMFKAVYEYGWRNKYVDDISPKDVDTAFPLLVSTFGSSKARQITKVMKRVWNFGYRAGYIKQNPWAKMGLKSIRPRDAVWIPEAISLVLKASVNTEFFDFFYLLYMTGQRPVDILNLDFNTDITDGVLVIPQRKTGKTVYIKLPQFWSDHLQRTTAFTPPFKRNYHNIWASLKAKLNDPRLQNLQLRDLRRTVLTEMASGGATDAQIRAVGRHSPNSHIQEAVYIQTDARQASEGLSKRDQVHSLISPRDTWFDLVNEKNMQDDDFSG